MAMTHKLKIFELRAETVRLTNGQTGTMERPHLLLETTILGSNIDEARAAAKEDVLRRTGRAPRTLNSLAEGGFSAIVPARS
jgi:hypothetical protein